MPTKNIECQLAQGQIGRYLAGANMSDESVAQLEGHIAECEDCSTFIDQKRKSLKELATLRKAAVYMEEPAVSEAVEATPEPKHPSAKALIDAIREKSSATKPDAAVLDTKREAGTARVTHWKALAYSTGLGLVLYGMTFVTANPTSLFGDRAAEATPTADSETKTPEPAKPEPKPTSTASKADGDPFTEDAPAAAAKKPAATTKSTTADAGENAATKSALPTTNSVTSTPTPPRVQVRSNPVSRPVRAVRRNPAAATRRPNSIRVYDENGRPITGG